MIGQGTQDSLNLPEFSESYYNGLLENGVNATLVLVEGGEHGFYVDFDSPQNRQARCVYEPKIQTILGPVQ